MNHADVIYNWIHDHNLRYWEFDLLVERRMGWVEGVINNRTAITVNSALLIEQKTGLDAVDLLTRQVKWQVESKKKMKQKKFEPDDILDMADLAALCGKKPGTISTWCSSHGVGEIKSGVRLVRGSDVESILEAIATSHQGNNAKRRETIEKRANSRKTRKSK